MSQMIEYVIILIAVISAVIALLQDDLLKAAILTGISGACIAFLYEMRCSFNPGNRWSCNYSDIHSFSYSKN